MGDFTTFNAEMAGEPFLWARFPYRVQPEAHDPPRAIGPVLCPSPDYLQHRADLLNARLTASPCVGRVQLAPDTSSACDPHGYVVGRIRNAVVSGAFLFGARLMAGSKEGLGK